MAFVGKLNMGSISNFFSSVQNIYNELNPATLSGAVDIVVVEQQDGELACSPFHVRFGKFSLLMPQEKKVVITVNDQIVPYVMKLGEAGEAFFVFETEHEVPEEFQTSPLLEAVDETKTGEEPPYLDIGESKGQSTTASTEIKGSKDKKDQDEKDEFDEDEGEDGEDKRDKLPNIETALPNNSTNDINKIRIPAELQSPKMIIEEQMDKVVTKMDPYQKHHHQHLEHMTDKLTLQDDDKKIANHDTYPLDDGSTLLERVQPAEAVTSTTIAKETFIVRPTHGDINSKWMDVTHTSVYNKLPDLEVNNHNDKRASQQQQLQQKEQKQPLPQKNAEHESIVLDIAGYKTENDHHHHRHNHYDKTNKVLVNHHNDGHDIQQQDELIDSPQPLENNHQGDKNHSNKEAEEEGEKEEPKKEVTETTTTGWGWGNTRRKSTSPPQSSSPSSLATTTNTTMMTQTRKSRSSSTSMVGTKKLQLEPGVVYRIELSLCGLTTFGTKEEDNATLFNEHQITYDKFVHNPNLLNDQRLVFRYEGRYYAAGRTGPLFTSLFLFHEPPPMDKVTEEGRKHDNECGHPDKENRPHQDNNQDSDSRESYLFGRGWRQWWSRSSVTGPTSAMDNNNLSAGPNDDNRVNKDGEEEKNEKTTTTRLTTTTTTTSVGWSPDHHHEHHPLDQQKQTLEEQQPVMVPPTPHKNYAKTLRLTSDQLKCLGLKKGANTISFSVTTEYQGTAICMAQIFYWDHDIQIVISDIDGTITKSDALGHVFNFIGKDWTHTGVAKLYTDITNNGYHILYLTSRAIGQADYTRDYLKRVEQDGKHQLPAGPVIMSPDRLFTSFHREVIMRKPEVFKMACLRDIQRLFGDDSKPFYAGFGNRITDAISYRSVHVPASRIFTIDPNGDVKLELLLGFLSSYIHLNDLVDQIFPPINKNIGEEFNDWNYWKQPLPEIDIPDLPIISSTKASVSSTNGGTTPSGDGGGDGNNSKTPGSNGMKIHSHGSSVSILPPVSPKPVPIKPDPTGALPSETIIESEAQKQRQQRSKLLRSFTSRSSSTTTNNSISESTPLSSRLGARHFSTSTPSLVITSRSGRTSPAESARSASPPSPSSPENEKYHAIPHYSSSDDLLSAPNSNNNNATSPAPSSTSSTSSLMNKMTTGFGGVLSRTFAARKSSLSEELLDHPATLSRTGSKGEVDDQQPTFDMDDEDDELDLDSIPFI